MKQKVKEMINNSLIMFISTSELLVKKKSPLLVGVNFHDFGSKSPSQLSNVIQEFILMNVQDN